jgi:hypothetical protein
MKRYIPVGVSAKHKMNKITPINFLKFFLIITYFNQ